MMKDAAYKPYLLPEMSQLNQYWIDGNNGLLAENSCENAVQLLFIEGTQPEQQSDCEANESGNWFINLFN
jgi:hypothetical protein